MDSMKDKCHGLLSLWGVNRVLTASKISYAEDLLYLQVRLLNANYTRDGQNPQSVKDSEPLL
jgi:hypothetical protein